MANLNTLSENMSQLTKSVNETLSLINGYTEASSSNDSTVEVKLADGSTVTMPSYGNVAKRLERVEDTMAAFVQGSGVVETDDGTFRKVQVTTVPKAPKVSKKPTSKAVNKSADKKPAAKKPAAKKTTK